LPEIQWAGRSAAAKSLDEKVIRQDVIAHILHKETYYGESLSQGAERSTRAEVNGNVENMLADWK